MTEDEAKKKTCHRTLAAVPDLTGGWQYASTICLASQCMAWRWNDAKRTAAFLDAVQAHMKTQPKPNFAAATQHVYQEQGSRFEHTEGYCGLAGAQP